MVCSFELTSSFLALKASERVNETVPGRKLPAEIYKLQNQQGDPESGKMRIFDID
jgi:hypothetical protein